MTRYSSTERLGVTEVEKIFLQFNWIPRTIFQTDVGIDMTVEICKNGDPVGKFVGVQIKTGESYFKEKQSNFIIFRTDRTHIDYWINNSLPIIIVLHNNLTNITIWQAINKQTVESTGENFKIRVPISNSLDFKSIDAIEKLTETSPLLNKFQKLLLDKPIIDKLIWGEKVVVDLKKWINKSSGKADIKIYHAKYVSDFDEDSDEEIEEDDKEVELVLLTEYTAIGIQSYQSLYYFYPWANFKIDESFYESFSDYNEDEEPGYKLVFHDDRFHGYKLPIIPYHSNGEISSYRLVISLNDYGHSFVDFYDFVIGNKQLRIKFDKK
jgi:hypothetical protein